ncbi:DNA glycosylase [Clostridia bacterium]|nr:DNA glycosylase [Clostridia bacterium]
MVTCHVIEGIRDFNTGQIFECGQCFRWVRGADGGYTGVVQGCFANIYYNNEEDVITIWSDYMPHSETLRDAFWRDYLDLNRDYAAIKRTLSEKDPVMYDATYAGAGIRLLNQDPWETLISFIISQNSNIPRIRGCIEALCTAFGERIGNSGGRELFAFPTIKRLASLKESELDVCSLGYRAKYVVEAARQVNVDGGAFLATAGKANEEKTEAYLTSLSGVGPKVAHCVMLFALRKTDVFPIDVWMARVMSELYGIEESDHNAMRAYAWEHFSPWSGIAQQYLFHYARNIKK